MWKSRSFVNFAIMKRVLILAIVVFAALVASAQVQNVQRKRCTPEAGEYIDLLLTRCGLDPAMYHRSFVTINRKRLGADESLLLGVSYELPVASDLDEDVRTRRKKVFPQNGDYIEAFLRRNGVDPVACRKLFLALNDGRFGNNYSLLLDRDYYLPSIAEAEDPSTALATYLDSKKSKIEKLESSSKYVDEPLLGKAYSHVELVDKKLDGATYYLVSGHGGPDPGAMSEYAGKTVCEDEYAYDIILRLGRQLLSHGAKVHFIIQDPDDGIRDDAILGNDDHETCMGEVIPLDQIKRLGQRSKTINSLYESERKGYCRAVIIHVDSRSKDERIDIFFYHFMNSKKGEKLANSLQETMAAKYKKHQPNRGFKGTVSARNLFVLRETNPVGVFLELGNIQNADDMQRFVVPNNREAVARWGCEGLMNDYKKI